MAPTPAPPGTPTRARLWLLREVYAGRVRWMVASSEALLFGGEDGPADVTGLWMELVQSRWARVVPWDSNGPDPPTAETEPTTAGEEVLIQAAMKRSSR